MMDTPLISVLLPVYNSAGFLTATVESILAQTMTDFELLILNDGSTDGSEEVIRSFRDSRIRYFHHPNQGLVYTLNRGITEARGRYIARIDADDICLPERFARQAAWLEEHSGTSVVSCFVTFIDENGAQTGSWEEDRKYYTAQQIRQQLPYINCVVHPGVMARTAVFREYRYDPAQQHIEDYDLWLRLLSDGHVIEKVPEVLLLYRVHNASVTAASLKKKNIFLKQYNCKRRFLARRLSKGSFHIFDLQVAFGMCKDLLIGTGKWIKQKMNVSTAHS